MIGSLFARRRSVEQVELGDELAPRFDGCGLIPAIVVDTTSQQILMLGYMNAQALQRTIETREAHFMVPQSANDLAQRRA